MLIMLVVCAAFAVLSMVLWALTAGAAQYLTRLKNERNALKQWLHEVVPHAVLEFGAMDYGVEWNPVQTKDKRRAVQAQPIGSRIQRHMKALSGVVNLKCEDPDDEGVVCPCCQKRLKILSDANVIDAYLIIK